MFAALRRAADRPLGAVEFRSEPAIAAFFRGWAQHSSYDRALAVGLRRDHDLETVVSEYIEDYLR